jgi:hypothetical protein
MEAETPPRRPERDPADGPDAGVVGAGWETAKPHRHQTTNRSNRPVQRMGSRPDSRPPDVRARPHRQRLRSSVWACRHRQSAVLRGRCSRPRRPQARARALPLRPGVRRARTDDARASAGRRAAEAASPSAAASRTSDPDSAIRSPAGFLLRRVPVPPLPAEAFETRTEAGDATAWRDLTPARAGSTSRSRACRARSSGTAQRATFASGRARVSSSWPSASVSCGPAAPCGQVSWGCAPVRRLVWERPGQDAWRPAPRGSGARV